MTEYSLSPLIEEYESQSVRNWNWNWNEAEKRERGETLREGKKKIDERESEG
ncbi:hypothetical protein ACUX4R_26095 [Salmonella enterica]